MNFNIWQPQDWLIGLTNHKDQGYSQPPYHHANMAFHVGDRLQDVLSNRQLLLKSLRLDQQQLVCVYQSHSDIFKKVSLSDGGAGATCFESGIPADGIYTYETNLALAIFHADCVPVFLYDDKLKWVALIHAGIEGTLKKITEKAIAHLIKEEKSDPNNIYAYLGPSRTFQSYQIDQTIALKILRDHPDFHYAIKKSDGHYYIDVPLLNWGQLRAQQIPAKNITMSGIDTYTNEKHYFSAHRHNITGRHLSIIRRLK